MSQDESLDSLVVGVAGIDLRKVDRLGDLLSIEIAGHDGQQLEFADCHTDAPAGGGTNARPFDAIVHLVADTEQLSSALDKAMTSQRIAGWAIFVADAIRTFQRALPVVPTKGWVRKYAFHRGPVHLSVEAYRKAFTHHFEVTYEHMHTVQQYRQTDVRIVLGPLAFPAQGISEFWYADESAMNDPYLGDKYAHRAVHHDAQLFVDAPTTLSLTGSSAVIPR